jgi:adenine-specific DNA glycosylase
MMLRKDDRFSKVIEVVCRFKGGSTYTISKLTEIPENEVKKLINFLLSEGVLVEVAQTSDCNSCPLSKICPLRGSSSPSRKVAIYMLSSKGEELCRKIAKGIGVGGAAGI